MKNGDFVIISAYSSKNNIVVDTKISNAEAGLLTVLTLIGTSTVMGYGLKVGKFIVDKIKEKTRKEDEG